MDFFRKIREVLTPVRDNRNYWFYVMCDHCHEILKGRIDLFNHLSIQYGQGKNQSTYFCRKVMIGSNRCYRPIEVEVTFDASRKLIDRQIKGGKFVSEGEYQAYQNGMGK